MNGNPMLSSNHLTKEYHPKDLYQVPLKTKRICTKLSLLSFVQKVGLSCSKAIRKCCAELEITRNRATNILKITRKIIKRSK
jgi:hypothetical protein